MRNNSSPWRLAAITVSLAWATATAALADVKLPAVFTDHMVLQRDMAVPVWGWADRGEQVTVKFLGQTKATRADAQGKWMLRLDPLATGGPHKLTIAGNNQIELDDVLVGEVWLCSGQSNMQMGVNRANNAEAEIAAAQYPNIRLISVPQFGTQEPQYDFQGEWQPCSPETVATFSATAYFFGRELANELDVPIGLIHCSWGGSACEAWVERAVLESDAQYQPLLQSWDRLAASYDPEKQKVDRQKALERWKQAAARAKAAGEPRPAAPRAPTDPRVGQHRPANCYNGMLLPLIPYAIRGAIWYQGESNASRAYQYRSLFPLMISSWREDWQQGDFPFYFVQLANFKARLEEPAESDWAELREAQLMSLKTPNTGMAVIIDIGEAEDIHPKNKQDVGKRLALWALAKDYGRKIEYSGPLYRSMQIEGDKATIQFDHTSGGLMAKGGKLTGFAVAGADKKFVWASATIDGDKVIVSSPAVAQPVAVRYAWADNPSANLYNGQGLPASPFRTDDWPGITAAKAAP